MTTQQPPAPTATGIHSTEVGAPPAAAAPLNLVHVLQTMLGVSSKVSDLIFSPGRPPQVELVGKLQGVPIPAAKLTPRTLGHSKSSWRDPRHRDLEKFGRRVSSRARPARFRSISSCARHHALVMRVIPTAANWNYLICRHRLKSCRTQTASSVRARPGKSSTLAAVIDLTQEKSPHRHLEDPIEFLQATKLTIPSANFIRYARFRTPLPPRCDRLRK